MNKVFETLETNDPEIIVLSFVDDFGFLSCCKSAEDVTKILQLVRKKIIK